MLRDFFLGFIKIHILYHATKQPVYGLWLIEELGRHGYKLGPGTLYPILHSMEDTGYLRCNRQLVEGKIRKYYVATEQGNQALRESLEKIKELVDEVVEERSE